MKLLDILLLLLFAVPVSAQWNVGLDRELVKDNKVYDVQILKEQLRLFAPPAYEEIKNLTPGDALCSYGVPEDIDIKIYHVVPQEDGTRLESGPYFIRPAQLIETKKAWYFISARIFTLTPLESQVRRRNDGFLLDLVIFLKQDLGLVKLVEHRSFISTELYEQYRQVSVFARDKYLLKEKFPQFFNSLP